MCDFYLITVTDPDDKVVSENQFGPNNGVPEDEVCTCSMWIGDTGAAKNLMNMVRGYLKRMPYGKLTIERCV